MNGLYILQRAFEHLVADRSRSDAELTSIGVELGKYSPENASGEDFQEYIKLVKLGNPSILMETK